MIRINEKRFLKALNKQGKIGLLSPEEGGGYNRSSFSSDDIIHRQLFCETIRANGLELLVDGAANISSVLYCSNPEAKTVLIGSHLDSVPNGGSLDGAYGVWAGVEILLTLKENHSALPFHVEVISFTDEEGRFGDLFGSAALSGTLSREAARAFIEKAGQSPHDLKNIEEMHSIELSEDSIISSKRSSDSLARYIEIHIEQGPQLEHHSKQIGIVRSIFGRRSMIIKFQGRSDHAGTTPLNLRADSLVAAANFVAKITDLVSGNYPESVLTCGNITAKPGVLNVVARETTLFLEFRSSSEDDLEEINQRILELLTETTDAKDLSFIINSRESQKPVAMDENCQSLINQSCQRLSIDPMIIASGASHDAVNMANLTPTGMIFVPSIGGRSHCPDERTEDNDLIAGANVVLHSILALADQM
ncbi:MAG: M20 family metallo-hydrolase [Proteobacteria bacterium]|nr:M20 family metallo-hydrolase [Pseudomonadota bacterium]